MNLIRPEYAVLLILLIVVAFIIYKLRQPIALITGGADFKEKPFSIKRMKLSNNTLKMINTIDDENMKHSQFVLGSITKIFTCLTLLILHQKRKLDIHGKIKQYVNKKELNDITIIDLMNHMSGIKRNPDDLSIKTKKKYKNATAAYNSFKNEKLVTMPPEYNYSNLGYIILGKIIEDVTGRDYYETIKSLVLDPLDMTNTTVENNSILYHNEKELTSEQKNEKYFATTAGSLSSTLKDMIKFQKFPKLVDLNLLEQLRFYSYSGNHRVKHGGCIFGGKSRLSIEWGKESNLFLYVEMV